ncbi:MAG: hypothetical protein WDZ69_00575 [Candidatus Pacearchaeota archaeon]
MNLEEVSGRNGVGIEDPMSFIKEISEFREGLDEVRGLSLSEEAEIFEVDTEGKYSPEQYMGGIKVGLEKIGYHISQTETDEKNPSMHYLKLERRELKND